MSDTPETDKLFECMWDSKAEGFSYVVQAGHARRLERERDAALAREAVLQKQVAELRDTIESLTHTNP